MNYILPVKRLKPTAIMPKRATQGSAGFDLCACLDAPLEIKPNERVRVPIGIAVALPENTVGLIYARSGLAFKHGIHMANDVGVIDSDYRGELLVPVHNMSEESYTVQPGERIAQLVVSPIVLPEVLEAEELDDTSRGEGGFGSTGK